jgi:hypothetical protein
MRPFSQMDLRISFRSSASHRTLCSVGLTQPVCTLCKNPFQLLAIDSDCNEVKSTNLILRRVSNKALAIRQPRNIGGSNSISLFIRAYFHSRSLPDAYTAVHGALVTQKYTHSSTLLHTCTSFPGLSPHTDLRFYLFPWRWPLL